MTAGASYVRKDSNDMVGVSNSSKSSILAGESSAGDSFGATRGRPGYTKGDVKGGREISN